MTPVRLLITAVSVVTLAVLVGAQVPLPPSPGGAGTSGAAVDVGSMRFEVASVKVNRSGEPFIRMGGGRGQYQATNVPLRLLIQQAFQLQPFQLVNAPDWTQETRYDITAKMPEKVQLTPGIQQAMLRALLEERFSLKTHRETRELQLMTLTLARVDGGVPAGLKPAPPECAPGARGRVGGPGGPEGGRAGSAALPPPPPPSFAPGQRPPCATMIGPGNLLAGNMTMQNLAQALSQQLGRVVQDRTGLTGSFEFELRYTPDQIPQPVLNGGLPPPGITLPTIDPNGPSLQTALQEQLGLKLESTRGPVDMTVIDRIERATED